MATLCESIYTILCVLGVCLGVYILFMVESKGAAMVISRFQVKL